MMAGLMTMMGGFRNGYQGGNSMMNLGGYGWMGIAGMILHAIFWIIVLVLAYKFIRAYSRRTAKDKTTNTPALEILRERYARGEIDTEEFNQRKNELTS